MTPTQAAALAKLTADGTLYAFNGVALPTVRALERRGLCTVHTQITTRRGPCGGRATYVDWWATRPTA